MINPVGIKSVSEKKAEQLYDSVAVCHYCETPFKECDTLIPGKGLVVGEMDVVAYNNALWHYGCVFDYEKDKDSRVLYE
ncbi:MAG: hypothetical protein COV72_08120 [Candidatus Omnitrophica bacterium CG11_big_fil_rev_8_21_14_0_20_42_13]|uniref:Uncharacterized protein n=1 Tax=Candidatus Ghiorseimicrobium undicola TaxID=1974746 RepID=A0A2H0LYB9_9BACT|nr:MAG: hypothetical protein COV72_08120 [Candidatus Omnitrophica bacterium CG11_big_fil_rev_8_21_14_0_20_42_13]